MSEVIFSSGSDQIWGGLYELIQNEYGVSALMGNIWAESGFNSTNVENGYGWTDAAYTQAVNNGTEDFTRDYLKADGTYSPLGYGICQWTSAGRKHQLYVLHVTLGVSIGNLSMQISFLKHELETTYSDVLTVLQNATDIRTASDYVLAHFEIPAGYDTPEVQEERADYGEQVYEHYSGNPPFIKKKHMPIWMYRRR